MIKNHFLFLLPFSFFRHFKKIIRTYDVKTILDVGCGNGDLMTNLKFDNNLEIDGVDDYSPYLKSAKKSGIYRKVFKGNILNFKPKGKYDLIFLSHVIEHFSKRDGALLLQNYLCRSAKIILLMTPFGFVKQEEYDGNLYQKHLSGWYPSDFKKMGFQTKILGLSAVFMKNNGDKLVETPASISCKKIMGIFTKLSPPYIFSWKLL